MKSKLLFLLLLTALPGFVNSQTIEIGDRIKIKTIDNRVFKGILDFCNDTILNIRKNQFTSFNINKDEIYQVYYYESTSRIGSIIGGLIGLGVGLGIAGIYDHNHSGATPDSRDGEFAYIVGGLGGLALGIGIGKTYGQYHLVRKRASRIDEIIQCNKNNGPPGITITISFNL